MDPGDSVLRALALNEIWLEFLVCAVPAWYATNGLVRGITALRRRVDRLARSRRFWTLVVTAGTMAAFALWGFFLAGTPFGTAEMTYASFVAALVLAVVSFSTLWGLGYGLTAPFFEVTAEATPVSSWQVHLFAARTWGPEGPVVDGAAPRSASLAHSAAYGDEGVLGAIAEWIRRSRSAACPGHVASDLLPNPPNAGPYLSPPPRDDC